MSKFYCNVCEEDVVLENGKCPKCKTNWSKVIKDSENFDAIAVDVNGKESGFTSRDFVNHADNGYVDISDEDIDNTINFFLKWGRIGAYLIIIFAFLLIVLALAAYDDLGPASIMLILGALLMVFYAIIFNHSLRWKAYMLYTNKKKNK